MADWKAELSGILERRARASRAAQESAQFEKFLKSVVSPAFNDLAAELRKHGRSVTIREAPVSMVISVRSAEMEEISFRVLRRSVPDAVIAYAEVRIRKGQRLVSTEANIREGIVPLDETTSEDVINSFLRHYAMVLDSEQTPQQ